MAKTYVPTLRVILNSTYKYCTRWQPKLEQSLTPTQITCLINLISALYECIVALGPQPVEP